MASRKTTTTVVEEETPKKETEYDKLHDNSMRDVVEETVTPKDDKPAPKKDKPKDKATVQVNPDEEEVDFDPEEFRKKTIAEAADTIIARIAGVKDDKNEKDRELISPWIKEKRNPRDYDEIAEWAVQKNQILQERRAREQEEQTKQQKAAYEAAQKENADRINAFIDKELGELVQDGKIPKIEDEKNPKDPGVIARQALFKAMLDVNQQLSKEGKPLEYSIYKIYSKYYKSPSRQPAGADAPVSVASRGTSETSTDDQIDYIRDIRRKPWHQILRGK